MGAKKIFLLDCTQSFEKCLIAGRSRHARIRIEVPEMIKVSDWKKSPFFSQIQGRLYKIKNHPFFSKAGETAVLNCSFYLHSDDLYSVKWYKVNFSSFLSDSGPVIAWLCQWLSGWMNTWWWNVKLLKQKKLLTLTCFLTIWLLEGRLQALQSILTVWEKPGNNQPPLDDSWQLGDSLEYFGCGLFRSCSIFFGQKNVTLVRPIVSLAMQSLSENFR